MMRIFLNQLKSYCTKIPLDFNSAEQLKNLKVGSQVTMIRTISAEDILSFAKLTDDYNPIHINSPKNIVHGALLNGLVSAVIGTQLPGPGTIVVEQLIKYPNPCYAGDTIEITVQLLSIRKIIKCKYSCIANAERTVLEGEAKLVLAKAKTKKIAFVK